MIMDFGSASDDGKGDSSGDMCDVVGELAQECGGSDVDAYLSAWLDEDLGAQRLEAIWEQFGRAAEESIAALPSTEKQNIAVIVLDAITTAAGQEDGSGSIRADVSKLLRD
jgi:hypothetical protein